MRRRRQDRTWQWVAGELAALREPGRIPVDVRERVVAAIEGLPRWTRVPARPGRRTALAALVVTLALLGAALAGLAQAWSGQELLWHLLRGGGIAAGGLFEAFATALASLAEGTLQALGRSAVSCWTFAVEWRETITGTAAGLVAVAVFAALGLAARELDRVRRERPGEA